MFPATSNNINFEPNFKLRNFAEGFKMVLKPLHGHAKKPSVYLNVQYCVETKLESKHPDKKSLFNFRLVLSFDPQIYFSTTDSLIDYFQVPNSRGVRLWSKRVILS